MTQQNNPITDLQRALDLYGAGRYWLITAEDCPVTANTVDKLRMRAIQAGASSAQLDDTDYYTTRLALRRDRPLMAGLSPEQFLTEHKDHIHGN